MTPSLHARIAAHSRWAVEEDRVAATEAARTAFLGRFERQVDPDGLLDPAERSTRAHSALKAHMSRMATKRWA